MLILAVLDEYDCTFDKETARATFINVVGKVMGPDCETNHVYEYWLPENIYDNLLEKYPQLITEEKNNSCKFTGVFTKKILEPMNTWCISAWLTNNLLTTTDDLEEE